MRVSVEIELDPSAPLHVEFAKWKDSAATPRDLATAIVVGYAAISNDALAGLAPDASDTIEKSRRECEERVARMREQHQKEIDLYVKASHDRADAWVKRYEALNDEFRTYVKSAVDDSKNREIESLKTQLRVIQSSNSYKGVQAEAQLKDVFKRWFPSHEVIDTSAQPGMSDVHIVDPEGFVVVVECKNKACVTALDVAKSKSDIETLSSKLGDRFVGYLFVSMKTKNIPKKGDLSYEWLDGKPCVWYGAADDAPAREIEREVVQWTRLLFCHKHYANRDPEDAIARINDYISKISDAKKNIDALHRSASSVKASADALSAALQSMFDDMTRIVGSKSSIVHACPHCSAAYKRPGDLKRHVASKHVVGEA